MPYSCWCIAQGCINKLDLHLALVLLVNCPTELTKLAVNLESMLNQNIGLAG